MEPLKLEILQSALSKRRIEWRKHVLQRIVERGIRQTNVLEILGGGERIKDYADDKPFPSALFLGYISGRPLHVVAALDESNETIFVITVYEPSLEIFESDYRTRRNK